MSETIGVDLNEAHEALLAAEQGPLHLPHFPIREPETGASLQESRSTIARQFTVTYRPCNHEIVVWEGRADEKPVIVEQIPTVCPLCGPPQPASSSPE